MKNEKSIKILALIAEDMKNDAEAFDGKPFTGETVGTYFGNHGAAIAALADIVKNYMEENQQGEGR